MTVDEIERLLDDIGLYNYEPVSIDLKGNAEIDFHINVYEIVLIDKDKSFIDSLIKYDDFDNERHMRNTIVLSMQPESNYWYDFKVRDKKLSLGPIAQTDEHYHQYGTHLHEIISKILKSTGIID